MNNNLNHILITGAAGFIGSAFVRLALEKQFEVTVLDALTYAGHLENLQELNANPKFHFVKGSINDYGLVNEIFQKNQFSGVLNFAAESHVDNSITGPKAFIETNILGTFNLLEVTRYHWSKYSLQAKNNFRFLHVSTDEVFGALGDTGKFSEATPYQPNSPYSASKAGSDHLVRAWHHTYGLPTITTNCSNNYGPRQFPEKLIPRMINCALHDKDLPVYGKGQNIRDWIHVDDHSYGVFLAFTRGLPGSTYCFGGNSERNNLQVVNTLCEILDEAKPRSDNQSYKSKIKFVDDRLGHDWRYAIDDSLAQKELGFERKYKNFESGLKATIDWYLQNQSWVQSVTGGKK